MCSSSAWPTCTTPTLEGARLIADILQTLDYEKTTMRNALQVRAMVIALG